MKTAFIYVVQIFLPLVIYSQGDISFENTNKKITFTSVGNSLTKSEKYKVLYPSRLTYFHTENIVRTLLTGTNSYTPLPIKAKQNLVKYDYLFEIRMTGISNFKTTTRWQRDDVGGPKGFVKDVTYNFPCELIVRDAAGKLIKRVEVIAKDKAFTAVYQPGNAAGTFVSVDKAEKLDTIFFHGHDAFYKKLEEGIAVDAYGKLTTVVQHLYGEFDSGKQPYIWGEVSMKNRTADYTDLDSANSRLKAGIDLYFDKQQEQAAEKFNAAETTYEQLLQSNEPRINKDVKSIVHYNLAWVYMFNKEFDKAWEQYNQAIATGFAPGSRHINELRSRIGMFELRDKVEKSK